MRAIADILAAVFALAFPFGLLVFVIYNKYRVRKIIKYLQSFFKEGKLTKLQLESLIRDYTSFLGYTVWFPDQKVYPSIYSSSFASFRRRSKFILLAAISLIALGTLCGFLSDLFAHHFYMA